MAKLTLAERIEQLTDEQAKLVLQRLITLTEPWDRYALGGAIMTIEVKHPRSSNDTRHDEASFALLESWIMARGSIIGERSHDFAADYNALITEAKQWAMRLGIKWHDSVVPFHMWETIAIAAEDDESSS